MANYEVGYGKPSKAVQFKKGISGNPRGRPKGKRNLITVLQQTLNETVVIEDKGKKRTVTNLEAAIRRLVNSATAGDMHAFRALSALTLSAEDAAAPETSDDLAEQDRKMIEILVKSIKSAG
jgi:hypothetical protein